MKEVQQIVDGNILHKQFAKISLLNIFLQHDSHGLCSNAYFFIAGKGIISKDCKCIKKIQNRIAIVEKNYLFCRNQVKQLFQFLKFLL